MCKKQLITNWIAFVTAAVALACGPVRADDPTDKEQERKLIAVLDSDAPPQEKAITCKRLAVYGSKDAVPALGKLLSNKELSSWARIALEAIPDPAADEVLREASKTLKGRLLVGVVNSIGVRRDAQAVAALQPHLRDADAQVASAAAVALGRIGNAAATAALEQSLADSPDAVRSAVAEGCILCAERLLAEDKSDEAARLYDKVRTAEVPKQRILEATRGVILARKSDGIPILVEQLRSADKDLFAIALRTSRELSGSDVTATLVTELSKATPDRQPLLIVALADRGDEAALPTILQMAGSGQTRVRAAAIGVLERIGDVSCVATLLKIASEADAELAQAAKGALEGLPGEEVDRDLADRLRQAKGQTRRALIELVGLRRIDAVPALIQAADDADPQIRAAALTALGSTVGPGDLQVLIQRVASPSSSDDTQAVQQALRTACVRMPDRDAVAEQLVAAMSRASVPAKCALLETIGSVGGTQALQSVATAAKDRNPELQDTASRLLGKWMTADAAPVLLDLSKTAPEEKYRIRALRGYLRIARQFTFPVQQRAEMCRSAFQAATRDAERQLVLEILERHPSIETLELAIEASKVPSLKNSAAKTSLAIAQKIGGKSIDVEELLSRIGRDPMKVEIVKAEYGAKGYTKDVTDILRKHVGKFPLVVLPSARYNDNFGDPAAGVPKQLHIQYKLNGVAGKVSLPENATIILPIPGDSS